MSYATVAELRQYLPQVPELGQQSITVTGSPSGGTFTLTYEGSSTAAIAYNATATAVQTALRAVTAIGSNIKVTGRPGAWVASFQGTLATDAGPLDLDDNSLTGGTSPSVTIEPTTDTLLQAALDRATDMVRSALRSLLADPTFDYTAYGAASTKIVYGYNSEYLTLPAYQLGSITLVEDQSGYSPSIYSTVDSDLYEAQADGRVYRAGGWSGATRYRVTAAWGYGPTPPDAVVQLVLELAVNIWRSRDKGGFTEIVGTEGAGAIRQIAGLNKQQQMILEDLRDQLIVIGV